MFAVYMYLQVLDVIIICVNYFIYIGVCDRIVATIIIRISVLSVSVYVYVL